VVPAVTPLPPPPTALLPFLADWLWQGSLADALRLADAWMTHALACSYFSHTHNLKL
jgi:hypothetical protein